ncbi:energy transducer TonB [Rufibacter tibetensis]|uniref:energy transducer TonB n=1 Tax=Rufibacter tibetensis TaxID=512763 RepID=UPI000785A4F7|nr:energy transducer TonB [Rufibacter tibetensis]
MQTRLICFLLVIAGVLQKHKATAQVVPVTIFYDQNLMITIKQKAALTRVASLDTVAYVFRGAVTDYLSDGQLYQQFTYAEAGKEGPFQALHPEKKVAREGAFKENQPVGIWKFYYPDGKPLQTVEFLPDQEYRVLEYYNFLGQQLIKDGTGNLETTSRVRVGYAYMNLLLEGQWKDGKKTGQWQFLQADGKKVLVREYENGVVRKRKLYHPQNGGLIDSKVNQDGESWPFLMTLREMEKLNFDKAVFGSKEGILQYILKKEHLLSIDSLRLAGSLDSGSKPEFPGGEAAMFRFLGSHFRIPVNDMRNKINGTVRVSFVVGEDGSVSDPLIVESLSRGVDAEALRVVRLMPKWKPAVINGKPVAYTYTIPYTIRMK